MCAGNGVGKPCFDFQSISNSSSPTDSKQTAPKLYPNLTIRLVFPALCAILFLVFLFYVWQCLPCCSTQGLIHSNDNIMFNVTIPGLQDKCVVSVDEEKDATKSPVSIFVPLADSLKFYIDKLNYSLVDAIKKQLQLQSSCATGLIGLSPYFYLSHGSSIDYEICLKLVFVENVFNGKLHVFDSEETFFDYLNTKDCGSHYALKTHNLLLGSDGQYSCTKVHVEADKNGYYFIASKAPANISYYYNYNISKVHLETTDLPNRVCTISNYDANECSIKSSSLHKKTVVFYLHPVGDKDNPINISFSCVCSLEWLGFFYFPDFKTATVWMLSSFTFCCCLFLFTGRI